MFVTVETTVCTVLGAFETTLCAVEVTCCTGDCEGDPPLPELVGCGEEPELSPPLGAVWVDVGVVDGWLAGVGDECDVERGGAVDDGALGAGAEGAALEVEVLEPDLVEGVAEPVAVTVAVAGLAARGDVPATVG